MLGKVTNALEDGIKMRKVLQKMKGNPAFSSLKCSKSKFRVALL